MNKKHLLITMCIMSSLCIAILSCKQSKTCHQSPVLLASQFMRSVVEGKHNDLASITTGGSASALTTWQTKYETLSVRNKNKLRSCSFLFSQEKPTLNQEDSSMYIFLLSTVGKKEISQTLHIVKNQNCYLIDWQSSKINIIKLLD